ncbi:MAG TPA: flap endonuclease-1 [Candidatus Bathyarchaeota archaeon]|nr:flap endonuclease-1 [Candidatus Bathyarchaeota archaeon]
MGVDLKGLIPESLIHVVSLKELRGKRIAIDAYNALYQFLSIIRGPDGRPLMDSSGRVTSHLSGLFYRTVNLLELGIKPIYIFDGQPPALKEAEIKRRMRIREEALRKYEEALREGRLEDARKYAQASAKLKDYMVEDSKRLLELLGVPYVQAPSEGEAQAAHLVKRGDADLCASQDYDSLLFGTPSLARNITISGRRKLPRKPVYVEVNPEIIRLDEVLEKLGITREQLVDIGILIGTDYNPQGIKGIGPKKAYKLIKEHGSLEKVLPLLPEAEFPVDPDQIRKIFLEPKVTDNYELSWGSPDEEAIIRFLCQERDFSEERVKKALGRIRAAKKKEKTMDLTQFF